LDIIFQQLKLNCVWKGSAKVNRF